MSYETDLVFTVDETQRSLDVDCPDCSAKNNVAADEYVPNKNGVFLDNLHYGLRCSECGRQIIIQTKFAV